MLRHRVDLPGAALAVELSLLHDKHIEDDVAERTCHPVSCHRRLDPA